MTTLTDRNETMTAGSPIGFAPTPKARAAGRYVTLFLVLPGMNKVAPGVAMLIGRLLQETIERDLAAKSLLKEEPASSRAIMAAMQRETAQRLHGIRAGEKNDDSDPSVEAANRFAADLAGRLYGGPLLSFVRHEDQYYFVFAVTEIEIAERTVEKELQRLGFLELAEIGRFNAATNFSAAYYPSSPDSPITPHCIEVLKAAGLLPPCD